MARATIHQGRRPHGLPPGEAIPVPLDSAVRHAAAAAVGGVDGLARGARVDGVDVDVEAAGKLIANACRPVILAHINPDADALGSALALALALAALGTDVCVAFAEPAAVPASLSGLPGQSLIRPAGEIPLDADLVITVDVNSRERLGSLSRMLDSGVDALVIDHHASNTRFGSHNLIAARAESTTVMIAEILDFLQLPLSAEIGANLYAGLATDSVGFRHASAAAHTLAARLLESGVEPEELMRPITDTHPQGWLGMLSAVLGRAQLIATAAGGKGLAWTSISTLDAAGMRPEELDSVIDIVRTVAEADVAAVLKQNGTGSWQVSLRSQPGVDVAAVATSLGGGGHRHAAGFTFRGSVDEAVQALTSALAA